MQILLLSSLYLPHVGGAERQAHALAKALRARGIGIIVLTSAVRGKPRTDEIEGVPVRRWISPLPLGPVWGMTYMLTTLWALLRLRRQYDLIHCQQCYLHTPVAVLFQRWLRKPVLVRLACTGRYGDLEVFGRIRYSGTLLRLAREARRFVALSRDGVAEAESIGVPPERILRIPNALLLPPRGDDPASPGDAVLFIGALRQQKGLDCLLDAFARLQGGIPLWLVGSGPERAALEDRARALGISQRVHFVGQVEDPSPYLRRARLFVLPSWAEGMSNALLEAMAFALPVVATRVGGNVDLIQDGVTGLLVEPGHPEQLAAAMARLLADEGLARTLGCNARGAILGQPSIKTMVDRYLEVYHSLVAADRP